MSKEQKSIFRKASMDRINSPEQLNEYIRVVTPSVWLILGAVTALLIGVVIWGIFGTIESSVGAGAVCTEENGVMCWVSAEHAEKLEKGMSVEINGQTGKVEAVSDAVRADAGSLDSYAMHLGGFGEGDFCRAVAVSDIDLPDGVYQAKIITERITPFSFITK